MKDKGIEESATYEEASSLNRIEDVTGLRDAELERAINDSMPKLCGRTLNYALAFVAGTGFTLFG